MERHKVNAVLLLAGLFLATPSRSQGTVYRVGPGRPLTTIQQAVILANNGDLLLVDPGTYPAFDVDGKSIAILADPAGNSFQVLLPRVGPAVRIRNIATQQSVTLQGCLVLVGSGGSPSLSVENCAGAVRLLDVRLDPVVDLPSASMPAAAVIRGCAAVALADVSIAPSTPRQGETTPGVLVGNRVDRGIAALLVEASRVRLTRCTLVGYDNRIGVPSGRFGGDGVRILTSGMVRVDDSPTKIVGGAGGDFGGNALHHLGPGNPDVLSCAVNPDAYRPGAGPNPGGFLAVRHDRGQVAPGVERFIPACLFASAGFVVGASRCALGSPCDLDVASFLGRPYWLFLGMSGHGGAPGVENPLYLDPSSPLLFGMAAGTLGTPPSVRVPLRIPALPALIGLQLAAQAVLGGPVGGGGPAFAFTSAALFVIVP